MTTSAGLKPEPLKPAAEHCAHTLGATGLKRPQDAALEQAA